MVIKQLIAVVSVLAIMPPCVVQAKNRHAHRGDAGCSRISHPLGWRDVATTRKREITVERERPSQSGEPVEVHVDAGPGRTLGQLLSDDLGAVVDWGSDRLAARVASGAYNGSRDVVAQALLKDFDFAIFHKDSRLHVVVVRLSAEAVSAPPPEETGASQSKPEADCRAASCVAPPPAVKRSK